MSDQPVLTDHHFRLAKQAAASAAKSGRGVCGYDELEGEAFLWLARNAKRVVQWDDEGRHGQNKVKHAARMHCLKVVDTERRKRSGLMRGDLHYYTPGLVEELLPSIFQYVDFNSSGDVQQERVRGSSSPSEGGNRQVMIIDVKQAFFSLNRKDQALLHELFADGGVSAEILAATFLVTERTIRRWRTRAVGKMLEWLGGEPPWWTPHND